MKVVFLGRYNESETLSGPEKVAKRLFAEHCRDNESEFYTYFFDGRQFGLKKKLFGKELITDTGNGKVIRAGIETITKELLNTEPDVIHITNFERFATLAEIVKKHTYCKIVYTVHGIASYENKHFKNVSNSYIQKDRIAEKRIFSASDKIAFLSEASMKIALDEYKIDKQKCVILPNGVDEQFEMNPEKNFDKGELRLVFCGNPSRREKGFDILTEALQDVQIPYELFVLNSEKRSAKSRTVYVEPMNTESLGSFYNDKHIFISPSRYEPFSIAAVEAMASGLTVIASEETGMSRYIKHGSNGFVFGLNQPSAIGNIITKLYEDKGLLANTSTEASKIGQALSWKQVYNMYRELY